MHSRRGSRLRTPPTRGQATVESVVSGGGGVQGGRCEGLTAGGPAPEGEGRPGYRSFAVTYAAMIVATMRTNTLAPNQPWLRNPGPLCECLRPHDMIASCGQPGPPAAFVTARIALSSNRCAPAIRFAASASSFSVSARSRSASADGSSTRVSRDAERVWDRRQRTAGDGGRRYGSDGGLEDGVSELGNPSFVG